MTEPFRTNYVYTYPFITLKKLKDIYENVLKNFDEKYYSENDEMYLRCITEFKNLLKTNEEFEKLVADFMSYTGYFVINDRNCAAFIISCHNLKDQM